MSFSIDIGSLKPLTATVSTVSAEWGWAERWNAMKMRWNIGRNNSTVTPGLYKIGSPNSNADVFVSANYRLSFDILRKNLAGFDAWILVIDTKGVNVWCAAGKGSFGTENVIKSIEKASLKDLVKHRRIIVPQLAAPGIAAFRVKERTGFRVVFGPVRARDISEFVNGGYKATAKMRTVHFPWYERAKLIPVDLMYAKYKLLFILAILFVFSGLDRQGFLFDKMIQTSIFPMLTTFACYIAGIVFAPIFLPYTPFRPFALKGAIWGLLASVLVAGNFNESVLNEMATSLIGISIASFMTMNFTGSTTFTSLSGVKLEMKWALPLQIGLAILGFLLFIISKLV